MSPAAFVHSPAYDADIGPHVFPTGKYRRVRERLAGMGLPPEAFTEPVPRDREILRLVHDPGYLEEFFGLRFSYRTVGSELPLNEEVTRWFETAVWGTVTAVEAALARGAALHVGGGFHHAFADHAEGFCYLNDVAVAARWVLAEDGGASRVSVVDLDVHQGNGTARIFAGDDRVFTFSMHQENNYPVKERSDLDLGLPDRIGDDEYLAALDGGLRTAVADRRPDLVFYVAGADPFRYDQLGGLDLSREGLAERDRRVFRACRDAGSRVAVLLAGGYASRLEDTVEIHLATARAMLEFWPWEPPEA